ncbi:unnamed protein product (mitochondrion) [Plasmodiophora brassicae]|uniref:PRELI/MSF1 domain-containing protein n=2 Tax=Plasmodiophora brassicae TaxID=37360 RepID=A0A3P3YCW0_PLABS|nr:unnamed protein product [Plasmodiophora brassicae]
MREARLVHTYKEPWHVVIQAYQERFRQLPHPKIPALVEATFNGFDYNAANQELTWIVLGKIELPIPSWVKRLSGCTHCTFRTTNTLNYKDRTMRIQITNDEYRQVAVVEETNCFRVHPDNDQWTEYEQVSRLTIRSLLGMQSQVEGIVMRSYSEQYEAGRQVDNDFIQQLLALGRLPARGFLEEMAIARLPVEQQGAVSPTHIDRTTTTTPLPSPVSHSKQDDGTGNETTKQVPPIPSPVNGSAGSSNIVTVV